MNPRGHKRAKGDILHQGEGYAPDMPLMPRPLRHACRESCHDRAKRAIELKQWGYKEGKLDMSRLQREPNTNPTNATRQAWREARRGVTRPLAGNGSAMAHPAKGQDGMPVGIAPDTRQTRPTPVLPSSEIVFIGVHSWFNPLSGGI